MNEITTNDRFQQKSLTLTRTVFGWVITGRAEITKMGNHNSSSSEIVCNFLQTNSALGISKFWCTEKVTKSTFTESEMVTNNHYDCTTKLIDGRFQVKLPFKLDAPPLGESKASALRSFLILEKRSEANPKLYQQYRDFIREFIDLKHLEEVPERELEMSSHKCFYLPHHFVQKESTTTKLRFGFDDKAKTSNKVSLNDVRWWEPKFKTIYSIIVSDSGAMLSVSMVMLPKCTDKSLWTKKISIFTACSGETHRKNRSRFTG